MLCSLLVLVLRICNSGCLITMSGYLNALPADVMTEIAGTSSLPFCFDSFLFILPSTTQVLPRNTCKNRGPYVIQVFLFELSAVIFACTAITYVFVGGKFRLSKQCENGL